MQLKDILCQIHPDHRIFCHGCRPFRSVAFNTTILAHCDAVWGGRQPPHLMCVAPTSHVRRRYVALESHVGRMCVSGASLLGRMLVAGESHMRRGRDAYEGWRRVRDAVP